MANRSGARLLVGLLVVLALGAGLLLGRGMSDDVPRVVDAVDVGFARDMKVHHAQAVHMSAVLHRRAADRELGLLAYDILTTQQGQIGIMTGWLDLWGHTQTSRAPVMQWMDHDGPMPGMASSEELAALEQLPVAELEEQYLRLMVRHHQGAVPMAEYAVEHATSPEVVRLARAMAQGQASEIEAMQAMLSARGLAPEAVPQQGHAPEPAASGHSGHG
ncbi:MAG: hypothetical protein JWM62_998 [Frankiales bacterium]|nr:hypothetical protein [Frankiales bacterium]